MTRSALCVLCLALVVGACAREDTASDTDRDLATAPADTSAPAPATAAPTPAGPVTLADAQAPQATSDHFAQLDADRSGTVMVAEHANNAAAMFATMDTNGDRRVTVEELDAARGSAEVESGASSADRIEVLDADHDGVLTAEEHAAGSKMQFAQMDANKDGQLSLDEVDVTQGARTNPRQ